MYTCEQCGADFEERVKSCLICGGDVHTNGTQQRYAHEPPPQYLPPSRQEQDDNQPEEHHDPEEKQRLRYSQHFLPSHQQQSYNEYLPPRDSYQPPRGTAESFRRLFGLHPTVAAIAIIFGGALATTELVSGILSFSPLAEIGIPVELGALVTGVVASIPLALVTYLAQTEWMHDSKRSAGIKALMIGLMTAIPGGVLGYKKLKKLMEELST